MKKLWYYISFLGVNKDEKSLHQKNLIMTNRINGLLLCMLVVVLIITRIDGFITDNPPGIGSIRLLLFIGVAGINLFLARNYYHRSSKISLIFIPPFLITVFPTLIGFVEEESFIYYPYLLVAFSLIPQLILSPKKEKGLYWISLVVFGFSTFFIDSLLRWNMEQPFEIVPIIDQFYTFYKLVPVVIFVFIHGSVYYLRSLNEVFEKEIKGKNMELDVQNEELKVTLENLKNAQKKLVQAEKMSALGNLVSGISHEINNPLNFIAGGLFHIEDLLDMYEMGNEPNVDATRENLKKSEEMISKGIGRITKVIQLLSVFSGIDQLEQKSIEIDQAIDGTLYFKSVKTEGVINIHKNYGKCPNVIAYQDQIHEVLLHIIENAIEAILDEKTFGDIFIETRLAEYNNRKCVEVLVDNNGPSIDDDELHKLFDPFYTLNKDTLHSGLGLTAAFAIMKEHKGSIEIKNSERGVMVILRFFDLGD